MGMMSEFKEFAIKGNVMDMAIGIIMGGAFGKIVAAFVGKICLPAIGYVMGGVDFTKITHSLGNNPNTGEPVVLGTGEFIQTIIDFTVIAFVIFMVVRLMNNLKKKEEEAAPAAPPQSEVLLAEIRDALKKA